MWCKFLGLFVNFGSQTRGVLQKFAGFTHGSRLGRAAAPAPVTASRPPGRQASQASLLPAAAPVRGTPLLRVLPGHGVRHGSGAEFMPRAMETKALITPASALHMHSDFCGCGDGVHHEPACFASSDRHLQLDCSNFLVWWSRHVFAKMSATIPCMLLLRYAPENNLRTNKWMMSVTAVVELSCSCTAI